VTVRPPRNPESPDHILEERIARIRPAGVGSRDYLVVSEIKPGGGVRSLILLPESGDMAKWQEAHSNRNFALAIISLIATALLGFGNFGYQIYRDRSNKASSETRFGKIEATLRLLTGAVAPQLQKAVDDNLSSALAKPNEAKDKLVRAESVIHQLRESTVSLPNDAVDRTSQQLNDLVTVKSDLPETWATVGEFITYRSQVIGGWRESTLPLCTHNAASGHSGTFKYRVKEGSKEVSHGPVEYDNCKIILDSLDATAELSLDLSFADVIFRHCVVFYNGGPIILFPIKVGAETPAKLVGSLNFQDCLFIFSFPTIPVPQGQQLARTILTTSGNNAVFTPSDRG